MDTTLLEIDEAIANELLEKLQTLIDLLFNINSWLEVLVVGLIASFIIYLFYLALKNFI